MKPKCLGGGYGWGCGACYSLLNSSTWQITHAARLDVARLQSRGLPKKCNLEYNSRSGLHKVVIDFLLSAGTALQVRHIAGSVPGTFDDDSLNTRDTPSLAALAKARRALRAGNPARDVAGQSELDAYLDTTGDTTDPVAGVDDAFLLKVANGYRHVLREGWRSDWKACRSGFLSSDGHKEWDDINVQATGLGHHSAHGLIGASQPWKGNLTKLESTARSTLSADAILEEIEWFCSLAQTPHSKWTYDLGSDPGAPESVKTKTAF